MRDRKAGTRVWSGKEPAEVVLLLLRPSLGLPPVRKLSPEHRAARSTALALAGPHDTGFRESAWTLALSLLLIAPPSTPQPATKRLPARAPPNKHQQQSNTTHNKLHRRQKTMTGATCFVCAKPANLRCSACAGKVEVSFCSKEHQKLVSPSCAVVLPTSPAHSVARRPGPLTNSLVASAPLRSCCHRFPSTRPTAP